MQDNIEEEIIKVEQDIKSISQHLEWHEVLLPEFRDEADLVSLQVSLATVQAKKDVLVKKRETMVKESHKFLIDCASLITNDKLKSITLDILRDKQFIDCPAAKKRHQAYRGGLIVHTAEVLEIALNIAKTRSIDVNHDILITAAIFHDYGKIWDYVEAPVVDDPAKQDRYADTQHQDLIRHLPRSYAVFMEMVGHKEDEVSEDTKMQISHCILAHHGRKEFGSPVEPQTPEAYAIHFADMMSANCTKDYYTRK